MEVENSMSAQSLVKPNVPADFSKAEWKARVELALAYRISVHLGWEYLIFNHITQRASDGPYFFVKPHHLTFAEVTASSLLKLRLDGKPATFDDNVNTAAYVIHTAILNARPDVNCTLHVHTVAGMAVSACKDGLLPLTQNALRFYKRLSYHDFQGFATEMDEAATLARDLGPVNTAMILRNHGLLTCGATATEAVSAMWALILCCETQLKVQASGAEIVMPAREVCEFGAKQFDGMRQNTFPAVHDAFVRLMDRQDPSYKT